MMRLSVVVPVLDEAETIADHLQSLAPLRAGGAEVIVVDGGSADDTRARARPGADRVLAAARGRARQMNAGAEAATGDILLFLHADTRLPPAADARIRETLAAGRRAWGRFDVRIAGSRRLLRIVAALMNRRSRLTGIATGDQAIFVRRHAFPGFPEIALMEDVAFSKAMKRRAPPTCRREKVRTSGRRWETRGVLRTIVLMWRLRLLYFLGARPEALARIYYG
jgi:rSAM/selenodomain-associated transferase 2